MTTQVEANIIIIETVQNEDFSSIVLFTMPVPLVIRF